MRQDELIRRLPKGDPLQRFEIFLAAEAVHAYIKASPHRAVRLSAPHVQAAAKMRGLSLPLSAISEALRLLLSR